LVGDADRPSQVAGTVATDKLPQIDRIPNKLPGDDLTKHMPGADLGAMIGGERALRVVRGGNSDARVGTDTPAK